MDHTCSQFSGMQRPFTAACFLHAPVM